TAENNATLTSGISLIGTDTTGASVSSVATSGSGTSTVTATVTVKAGTGSGTLGIQMPAGAVSDQATNASAATSATSLANVYNTLPTVGISAPSATYVNNGTTFTYTVTFTSGLMLTAESNATLASGISLIGTDTTGASVSSVATSGSGTNTVTATVTVSTGSGNGTLGIQMPAGAVSDQATNASAATSATSLANVYNTLPTVGISAPSATYVNNGTTFTYTVTFGSAIPLTPESNATLVSGISLIGTDTTGASVSSVATSGSGTNTVTATVTVKAGTGSGTLGIQMPAGAVSDQATNASAATSATSLANVYNTLPTVGISAPSATYVNNGTTFTYTVTFTSGLMLTAESNATLASGISLIGTDTTGASVSSVAASGSGTNTVTATVTVSTGSGNGTLGIQMPAGAVSDQATNASAATSATSLATVDNTLPTVGISAPSATYVNNGTTFTYTVTFGSAIPLTPESNATLVSGISLIGTDTTGASVSSVATSGSGTNTVTATVTVKAGTGSGTLGIQMPASSVSDAAGNASAATSATSLANVYNTPPTVGISAPSATYVNNGTTFTYTVTFTSGLMLTAENNATLTSGISLIGTDTTGASVSSVATSGSGTSTVTATVTVKAGTGNGTLGIQMPAGAVSD